MDARYASQIHALATRKARKLGRSQEDEDIAQETVYRLLCRESDFGGEIPTNYIRATATNAVIDRVRKERREEKVLAYAKQVARSSSSERPAECLERFERRESVCRAINAMKPSTRAIAILLYQETPPKEIANLLGISAPEAYTRIRQAKAELENLFVALGITL